MVKMAFNVSGIIIRGLEPVMNCLVGEVNQKQNIINKQSEEIENLKRESSENFGKPQRYIDHMKRERHGGTEVLRTKLLNWKNYILDLENDHYEGLKIYNIRIEELQRKLDWLHRNGRKFKTGNIKRNEEKGKENLELRNKLRKAEEEIATTSEQLISAKEERGELGKIYQEERTNAEKLRNELKKMDAETLSYKDEAKKLQEKVREVEEMNKCESEERGNPEENEIELSMGEEIRKLKKALDGKMNEMKKFKEGYNNSKMEHERVKKRLNKEIEELQMKMQQEKKEENDKEDVEKLK